MVSKETYRCSEHGWLFPTELAGSEKSGWKCPHCQRPVEKGRVEKMSKSKKNIVDPEDLVNAYGADTARLFTLFAAPPEKDLEWSDQGVEGGYRFLSRLWRFVYHNREALAAARSGPTAGESQAGLRELRRMVHRTIKKVTEDIDGRFHFNTAIAAIMELFNAISAATQDIEDGSELSGERASLVRGGIESIVILLAPFVPHIASELWEHLGHRERLDTVSWPVFSPEALETDELLIVVQVNGKIRSKITIPADISQERIEGIALADERVRAFLDGKKIRRLVHVPRRLINIVLEG
jgi:leucyl-tRNA synthetase